MAKEYSYLYVRRMLSKQGISENRITQIINSFLHPTDVSRKGEPLYSQNDVEKIFSKLAEYREHYFNLSELAKKLKWGRTAVTKVIKAHSNSIRTVKYPLVKRTSYHLDDVEGFLPVKPMKTKIYHLGKQELYPLMRVSFNTDDGKTKEGRVLFLRKYWYIRFDDGALQRLEKYEGNVCPLYQVSQQSGKIRQHGSEVRRKIKFEKIDDPYIGGLIDFLLEKVPRLSYRLEVSPKDKDITLHIMASDFILKITQEDTVASNFNDKLRRFKRGFTTVFGKEATVNITYVSASVVTVVFKNNQPHSYVTVPPEVKKLALKQAKKQGIRLTNLYSQILEKALKSGLF